MSRIEFMDELRALLADLSEEERDEALQYYNDYFDDAGAGNEASIIKELESPAKLASVIKAGLFGENEKDSEYGETGYTDTRFEKKDSPARKGEASSGYSYSGTGYSGTDYSNTGYSGTDYNGTSGEPRTSKVVKIILIVLIILIGAPIVIPIGIAILAVIFGLLCGLGALVFTVAVSGGALAVSGIVLFGAGLTQFIHSLPMGLGLTGAGLLMAAIGAALTVFMVWLVMKIVPPVFRWFVNLCRKLFQKGKVDKE